MHSQLFYFLCYGLIQKGYPHIDATILPRTEPKSPIMLSFDGSIERNQTDVVANKFTQEHTIDYLGDIWPFAYLSSLCIIILVIASKDWQFLQMDMKNVFLNKKLTQKKV